MAALVVPLSQVPDVVPRVRRSWRSWRLLPGSGKTQTIGMYTLEGKVGEGGFAKVRLGKVASNPDARVAVKVFKGAGAPEALRKEALAHVACHDHPNIPTCHDVLRTKATAFLVMEYAAGGDLFDHVRKQGPLAEPAAARLMHHLAFAVAHMHAKGFAHRDIKPENVLLAPGALGAKALLGDFGHAVQWTEKDELLTTVCGTVRCLPPEMFYMDEVTNTRQYNPRLMDAFGLGVVLFFALTGQFPFDGADPSDTAHNIVGGVLTTPFPKHVSDECASLLVGLLHVDPGCRLTVKEALSHPFLGICRCGSD